MAENNTNEQAGKVLEGLGKAAALVGDTLGGSTDYTKFLEKDYRIDIRSVTQNTSVSFKAFITGFSDSYECRWNSETGVGRMDPIQSYQGTGRKITMEWDVVARDFNEAKSNLAKCEKLIRMMYPVFRNVGGATRAVQTPPYFKFKFAILAASTQDNHGLMATCAGIEYAPDFDAGVFTGAGDKIYPKLVSLSVEMTIMHDHLLGFTNQGKDAFKGFPYGSASEKPKELEGNPDVNGDGTVDMMDVQALNLANLTGMSPETIAAMHEEAAQLEEANRQPEATATGGGAAAKVKVGEGTVLAPETAPPGTGTVLLPETPGGE